MPSITSIKSISYLKSNAALISEDLEMNGAPFFITQNGKASMVIESVKRFQEGIADRRLGSHRVG